MFKRFRGLCVFLLVCAVLFTSCRAKAPDDGNSSPGGSAQPGGEPTWRLVTPSRGLVLSGYADNGQGTYAVCTIPQRGGAQSVLVYYDYASMQLIYLSPQLDVTFDEENPGWLGSVSSALPIAMEDALYVFILGNSGESPARLLRMNPNGSERREITFTDNYDAALYSAVAWHDGSLYFIAQQYDSETGEIESVVLLKSDFENGKTVEVCKLDSGTDTSLVGAFEDGIILQKSVDGGSVYTFSVVDETGAETAVPLQWDAASQTRAVCGGQIVTCEVETGQVDAYNIATGETREVAALDTRGAFIVEEAFDGHVILEIYEASESGEEGDWSNMLQRLAIDLETGETKQLTLTRPTVWGDAAISIMAETPDSFLVAYSTHSEEVVAYAPGGSEYIAKSTVDDLALIDKDDYWNSVPNYRPFADAR